MESRAVPHKHIEHYAELHSGWFMDRHVTQAKPSDPVRAYTRYLSGSEKDVLSLGLGDVRVSAWSCWFLRRPKT